MSKQENLDRRAVVRQMLGLSMAGVAMAGCLAEGEASEAEPVQDGVARILVLPDTVLGLATYTPSGPGTIVVGGYYEPGDGAGGTFTWNPTSTASANGGTVIAPGSGPGRWLRLHDGVIDVRWFGARGNITSDDTAALKAAIASGHMHIHLPPGTYGLKAPLSLMSGQRLSGAGPGSSVLLVQTPIPAIVMNAVVGCEVSNLGVERASGGDGTGVLVYGGAQRVLVENVSALRFFRNFDLQSPVPLALNTDVTLRNCFGGSSTQYNISVQRSSNVLIESCVSRMSGYDGVKLLAQTYDVTIRGGHFSGSEHGDGIDAYAGGERFVIQDVVCEDNNFNGITIKTDLDSKEFTKNGIVRSVQVSNVRCYGNTGSGLTFHRHNGTNPEDDNSIPLAAHAVFTGCVLEGNGNYGLGLQGRNVTVVGSICRGNGLHGVKVLAASRDVDLIGLTVIGNGVSAPGSATSHGILIEGVRVSVSGGRVIGADDINVRTDADYDSLPRTQGYGIHIAAGSGDVSVSGVRIHHNLHGDILRGVGVPTPQLARPAERLAVTGSRAGNAALASLIQQLVALGLIDDSST
jgi:hypothetical protein